MQESCDFNIRENQAISSHYSGKVQSENYSVSFDWDARKINFADGQLLDMPQGYMVDTCNMPFAAALLQGNDLPNEILYVLDGAKKRILGYKLQSSNTEDLETPIGTIKTIKIVLERELKPERTLSFWLSPEHDYVPMKIEEKRTSRTTTMLVDAIDS